MPKIMLAAPSIEAYPPRPISPRPITPSEIPDSQIQWVFYYSFRISSNSNTIQIQDKGKTLKNFNFHNNADEMEKKCFRKGFFFFWEGRCNAEWSLRYWICGRSNNINYSSLVKRVKVYIEVDFIIKIMSWSYIFMPHFFCLKSHFVRQSITEDRINSRPQNNVLKLVYNFS